MKRKIFTSLLVAPLALNALADATVNDDLVGSGSSVWQPNGITGSQIVFGDKSASTTVAGGELSRTLSNMNPGKYKITFGNQDNVKVIVDGKELALRQNTKGWYAEFEVATAGNVELKITGQNNAKNFSFSNAQLILNFDFEAEMANLNAALADVDFDQVPTDDQIPNIQKYLDEAASFRTRRGNLETTKAMLQTDVNKLETEDNAELLNLYNTYKLWENPNALRGRLNTLSAYATAYNNELAAAIEKWNQVSANQTALGGLMNQIDALQTLIDDAEAKVNGVPQNPNVFGNKEKAQEYIDSKVMSEAAQTNLDAYKAAVQAAYSNLEGKDIQNPEGYEAVKSECEALAGQFSQALSIWNAYYNVVQLQARATAALSANLSAIDALKGVETKETNFDAYKETVKTQLNNLYAEAISKLVINIKADNIDENYTMENSVDDTKVLNAVIFEMQDVVETATSYVAEQNTLYTGYMAQIAEDQTNLNNCKDIENLPEAQQAELNALRKAAQDAIDALTNTVNETYAAGGDSDPKTPGLVADAYSAELADIDAKVKAVSDYLANWQPVVDIINSFEDLKTYIQQLQDNGNAKITNKDYEFGLVSQFQSTIKNIDDAIEHIKTLVGTDTDITQSLQDTQKSIDATKQNAEDMMNAYVAAATSVVGFEGKLSDLDGIINGKAVVGKADGNTYEPQSYTNSAGYLAFKNELEQFQKTLRQVRTGETGTGTLTPQEVYEKARSLAESISEYGVETHYNIVLMNFETVATESNYNFVEATLNKVKEAQAAGEYFGKETISFTEVENELSRIRTALDNAENEEIPVVKDFTTVDADLSNLLVKVQDIQKTIDDLKANQAAYDALIAAFNAKDFANEIKKLYAYNVENSMVPAIAHFSYLIGGSGTMVSNQSDSSLYNQNKNLKQAIEDALTNKTAVQDKEKLTADINNLATAISNMKLAIDANNAAYKGQMSKSDVVRARIDEILQVLKDADEHAGKVLPESQLWQDKLNELRNTDLPAVDVAANNHYGEGASEKWNLGENIDNIEGINGLGMMNRYDNILSQANDIFTQFTTNYGDLIKQTNEATVKDANWTGDISSMENTYVAAIQQYNEFFNLTNVKYREYILPIVGTHKVIFDYYKAIKDVEAKVQAWIAAQNDDKVAFTQEAFAEACVAAVNEVLSGIEGAAVDPQPADPTALKVMTTSINNRVDAMLAAANAAAKDYYNGNGTEAIAGIHPAAQNVVTIAEDALAASNIAPSFCEALTAAKKNLTAGEDKYDAESETRTFALQPMDQIANWFDEITTIDLQPAAVAQWNAYYQAAQTELTSLAERLKNLQGHNPEVETALAAKVAAAAEINTQALGEEELINSIVSYKAELDRILSEAAKIVTDEETRVAADNENKQLAEQYATTLTDLNGELDALKAYAASMMGGQGMTFGNVSALIDAFRTLVTETYPHALKANEAEIQTAISAVRAAIATGYTDVRNNESTVLNTLLDMVKVAFNNAAEAGDACTLKDQLETINKEIEALKPQVYALPGIESNDEFKTSALQLETALSNYYVQLKESYGDKTNEAAALLEALNNRYTTISGNIEAGITALNEGNYQMVIEQYASQYDELKNELEALKTAWNAEGNKIVMTAAGYNTQLDALEGTLTALNEEVVKAKEEAQAEQDRINANQAAYERLTAELNALKEEVAGVKAIVEGYGLTESLQHDIDNIDTLLAQAETALNADYEAVNLTEESTLKNASDIKAACTKLKVTAEKMNCKSKIDAALAALNAANEALGKRVVPEIKAELEATYQTLYSDYMQSYNQYQGGILDYNEGQMEAEALITIFGEVNTVMEEIIAKAGEIAAKAEENVFVPGNVDLDPNGLVNSSDLQTLIGWIGHGVTYQDLYEESPRAAAAANIVGDDVLNIADATALVQIILDEEAAEADPTAAPRRLAYRHGVQASESTYSLALLSNEHGSRKYAFSINNSESFVGGQIDVKLPSGMTLVDAQTTDRAADHQVLIFDNGNGWYRLILISNSNSEISGNSCALLILSTEGVGTPEMENVIFSDKDNTAVSLKQSGQAMVDTIMDYTRNGVDRIYNAAGQTMRTIQKGINIIRRSNGKTTKELRK